MAVTYEKETVTRTNPFDGSSETVIEVSDVAVDDVLTVEHYTFEDGTLDPAIQSAVEADLVAKGYVIG